MRKHVIALVIMVTLFLIPYQVFAQKEKWPPSIFICGGSSPQASIYILGATVAQVYNKYLGITASPLTVQGTIGSLNRLVKGEVDIGYSATTAYDLVFPPDPAKQQKEYPLLYKEKGKLRQIYATTSGAYHIFAKAGINSFTDLKGKRFAYEAPGWFGKSDMWEVLFEYYKLDRKKDIISMLEPQGVGDEGRLFKEGLVDASNKSSGFPVAAYTELLQDMAGKVHLLSLTDEAANYVRKELPYYTKVIIPARTYPGQDKDVIAMGYQNCYLVRTDMPEDFVYALVKTYHEHLEEIKAIHPQFKRQLSMNSSVSNLVMPVHPAAKKYYREVGIWNEKLEKEDKELLAKLGATK
jgi:TRAP transporter TAXI family solute receptor